VDIDYIDLFAGPGGWDEGAAMLGITNVLGVENDDSACQTAELAGHKRLNADIAALDPMLVTRRPVKGLIASPPCPGFSAAGKGLGRKDLEMLTTAIEIADRVPMDAILDKVRENQHDARSALTLEPLRWSLALMPEWISLEQVPSVLPLWQAYAVVLRARGYSVWVGYVHAEQYGVPQTRKRAVLIASRTKTVHEPTHSRYYPRNPEKLDEGVTKWVTMAEAIQRGMTHRPSMTVTGGGTSTGGAEPFGNAARQGMQREIDAGRWQVVPAIEGERADDITWPEERPSPTIVGSYHPEVVAAPGYRKAGDPPRQRTPGSVKITVEEAGILQSFSPDYPWQGKQGKQFQQVGNAVPPLLAAHILSVPTGRVLS
jgi:DNA (cytosine-5)-methyltransferase 1